MLPPRPSTRRARLPLFLAVTLGLSVAVLAALPVQSQGPKDLVNKRFTANVVSVIDGDTVDVVIPPGRKERVRLHGMDAPESGEPFTTVARNFLRVLMFSRDVTVTGKDVDRYGRLVGRIVVDGQDASERTIAAGLACTFHQYAREPALDAAMARARSSRLGFWAQPGQLPSCVARETNRGPMPLLGVLHVHRTGRLPIYEGSDMYRKCIFLYM